jgi:hypothetical protein
MKRPPLILLIVGGIILVLRHTSSNPRIDHQNPMTILAMSSSFFLLHWLNLRAARVSIVLPVEVGLPS